MTITSGMGFSANVINISLLPQLDRLCMQDFPMFPPQPLEKDNKERKNNKNKLISPRAHTKHGKFNNLVHGCTGVTEPFVFLFAES